MHAGYRERFPPTPFASLSLAWIFLDLCIGLEQFFLATQDTRFGVYFGRIFLTLYLCICLIKTFTKKFRARSLYMDQTSSPVASVSQRIYLIVFKFSIRDNTLCRSYSLQQRLWKPFDSSQSLDLLQFDRQQRTPSHPRCHNPYLESTASAPDIHQPLFDLDIFRHIFALVVCVRHPSDFSTDLFHRFYTGQYKDSDPPIALCIVQSSLMFGIAPM